MDVKKKQIKIHLSNDNFVGDIDSIINNLNRLKSLHYQKIDHIKINFDGYFVCSGSRLETEEEALIRQKQEEDAANQQLKIEEQKKKQRYLNFLELKREFESWLIN